MIGEDNLLEMGQEFLSEVKDKRSYRDNCVFGFSLDNGEVVTTRGSYCHGYVMEPEACFGTDDYKPVAINTRIQKGSKGYDSVFGHENGGLLPEDYFDEYYDFLFNRSIFADCYVTKTLDGLRKGGVVVVRCDRPANLMQAANIAIRRGWEYTSMSKSLVNMLRMGIEPNLAHLVSYQLTVGSDGKFKSQKYGDHQSIFSVYLDKSGVRNIRKGYLPPSHEYNIKNYDDVLNYNGLYGMWNDSGMKSLDTGSLTFVTSRAVSYYNRDPFKFITHLDIEAERTVQGAIEEALKLLEYNL